MFVTCSYDAQERCTTSSQRVKSVKSCLQTLTSKGSEHNLVSNRILIAMLYQAQHLLKGDNVTALFNIGYCVMFYNETL